MTKNLFSILTLGIFGTILVDSRSVDPRCQINRIPWCLGVYDAVTFPNFLGHQTQEEAYYAMHKLWPLIQTECSSQVLHYLCRLYAPQCPYISDARGSHYANYHPQQYRPPCEESCLTVRRDCHNVLLKHQIYWPAELECHNLRNKSCVESPQIGFRPTGPSEPAPVPEPEPTQTTALVTEPTTTEVPITPTPTDATATIKKDEDGLVEETESSSEAPVTSHSEPVTEEATESTTIDSETEEPESITADATTGSLLGINPVIQEEPNTPDRAGDDSSSGESSETATEAAPSSEATVDPRATGESGTNGANDDDGKEPRSDRAIGSSGVSYLRNCFRPSVEIMVIYLVAVSLILHR